jgi:hypothetical protein
MAEALPHGEVLLATFPLAAAMLVHEADGRLLGQLFPVTKADLVETARRVTGPVYTLDVPIDGRKITPSEYTILGRTHVLYRNDPAPAAPAAAGEGAR